MFVRTVCECCNALTDRCEFCNNDSVIFSKIKNVFICGDCFKPYDEEEEA